MKNPTLLSFALLLMAAPGFAQKVSVDWDRDYDFGGIETYAWMQSDEVEANPLMHQRIVNAIDYNLSMQGLREVDENPDIYVTYYSDSKDEVVIDTTHFGFGYGPGWYWGGGGMGSSTSRTHTYTRGSLVFDAWDAASKNMIFRGVITDTVSSKPEKNEKKINRGAEKMFKEFEKKRAREAKKS